MNCGDKTDAVRELLRLDPFLQPSIADASRSIASDNFITYFGDVTHASYVRSVFTNISTGAPVPESPNHHSPFIFCLTGPTQAYENTFGNHGEDKWSQYLRSRTPATSHVGTDDAPFVFLNPRFWEYPDKPSKAPGSCLTVQPHTNKYKESGERFASFRVFVLLHELVHHYTYYPKPGKKLKEYMDANLCMKLSGSKALMNAQNYVYYVANNYHGCTDFPSLRRRGKEVELLEVYQNSTSIDGGALEEDIASPY